MVNLLETPRVIVFFFNYMIDLLRLFQKKSFVLSNGGGSRNMFLAQLVIYKPGLHDNFLGTVPV